MNAKLVVYFCFMDRGVIKLSCQAHNIALFGSTYIAI